MQTQEHSSGRSESDPRNSSMQPFTLLQIDRATVVDQVKLDDGYVSEFVLATGPMRELCPHCMANHLNLVLRQKHVRHAHLYCDCCKTCFDARYPNGTSALELDE